MWQTSLTTAKPTRLLTRPDFRNDTVQPSEKIVDLSMSSPAEFRNCLGDLKKNVEYIIGMERMSGSMEVITPLYISRLLNVPIEEVEKVMKEM